jgi:hypothetical protein
MTREELIDKAVKMMWVCGHAAYEMNSEYPAALLRDSEKFAREVLDFLGWKLSEEKDGEENEPGPGGA